MYNLHGTECCFWGALATGAKAIGGAVLGGAASYQGGRDQRKHESAEALKNRQFQSDQASRQMGFQERMRNSEWQAGIADMEAAGVNPALAYSQGGASAPMGASASGSKADVTDILTPAVSTAMQAKRLSQELDNMKAQERQINAVSRKEAALATREEGTNAAYGVSYKGGNLRLDVDRGGLWNLIRAQIQSAEQGAEFGRLNLPGARNISRFEGGRMGSGTRTIRSLLQSVFGSGGAFRAR